MEPQTRRGYWCDERGAVPTCIYFRSVSKPVIFSASKRRRSLRALLTLLSKAPTEQPATAAA